MYNQKVFFLYPFCKLVSGFKRSAIYDLERGTIHLITNDVYVFIKNSCGKTKQEIYFENKNVDEEVIVNLIATLLKKEFICFLSKNDYPSFKYAFNDNNKETLLDNFVMDINADSKYKVLQCVDKLKNLSFSVFQIRFLSEVNAELFASVVKCVHSVNTASVEIVMPYNMLSTHSEQFHFVDLYKKVTNLYLWNAALDNQQKYKQCTIMSLRDEINNVNTCGIISKKSFACNKKFYFEARHRNTCLSKKCSIDVSGKLKNCPYMKCDYGYIDSITSDKLIDIIKSSNYQKFALIKKDNIKTCNVCEFRYACFDCRAFIEREAVFNAKPSKCKYNPYKAIWENNN